MGSIVLNLTKPGDEAPKLALNLNKGDLFKVRLTWDGATDLDLHSFVAFNDGSRAKVNDPLDVLSIYNTKRKLQGVEYGTLDFEADRSFKIRNGALEHSPDVTEGGAEFILIRPDRLTVPAGGQLEMPLIAMIHKGHAGKTFSTVQNPRVIVEDGNGVSLLDAALSTEFGPYIGIHAGSVIVQGNGQSHFEAIARGFDGDFNTVLSFFSGSD